MSRKQTMTAVALIASVLGAGCAKETSFSKDVNPILQKNCLPCHSVWGPGYAATGLSLESYDSLMKGTKFGAVTKPGFSGASALVIFVEYDHQPVNMPLGQKRLTPEDIKLIKTWIDQGAKNN